jgi:hypothetical protein
VVQILP